ncbi:hydroxyethylthiazole kinase [Kushneria sinocarnis]|uniref:Hydroxyethylthiazole kinase n=1 Tax=Kushneria sinocarnis TaxID=595502 RepID=A0A420WWR2_9GAMM|nr:hydroxyethylthiazole kinase [Kushneria sinocarnis]RKR03556.1 hydroxyethylthiazole kinase [Kushneria sinocarnis]
MAYSCAARLPCRETLATAHQRLNARNPLVHCLTNPVTAHFVANTLLAIGASPVMADHPDEAGEVARQADALLINLGTPSDSRLAAMQRATRAAREAERPWVLDPIGAGGLPRRRELALELMQHHPGVIRGNASEILGLAQQHSGGRGVDSAHTPREAHQAAHELLSRAGGVAISGASDQLFGMAEQAGQPRPLCMTIEGGSQWLPRVAGTGCALGAMVAAYAAVCTDLPTAMLAAHLHAAAAAERAEARAHGPGSFATAWLDALASVEPARLMERRVKIHWLDDYGRH